ncbi:hypothetical protein F8A90_01990 [Cobetia sp. cqz5-12]|uniref:P-loop NTPase n=1 Tax=Cobetia sp. cqz5-12 TaxID=2609415 RepID=UPI0019045DD7|nr:hypothetical protein [Cobetia sp. cqz5-12]QQK63038.1 hypothetical protein F8A90_01990 [Cobetia sp. cqz5-12]
MEIQSEAIFKHCLINGINLFLGSGFSVLASGTFIDTARTMPVGDGLKKELLQYFERDKNSKLSLPQLCSVLDSVSKDKLVGFLKRRFSVVDYNEEYNALLRVNVKSIFTTNIDDLVYKIYGNSLDHYLNDISVRGPSIGDGSSIDYIPLHGSVKYNNDDFDFSPLELATSFERDKDKWYGYIDRIKKVPTLYWGYSVSDAGVLQSLAKDTTGGQDRALSWIVLREDDEESREYYSSLGFQIIVGETDKLLKYFKQIKKPRNKSKSPMLAASSFKEYCIPDKAQLPVRTLDEFYLGAEPVWYDVMYGFLHKNEYYHKIKNDLAAGNNIIITGGSLAGKTTLLKLLSIDTFDFGWPFFIEEITPEKARLLKRDIDSEGKNVLIFIDNAADAWEAISDLTSSENIQVIAAERDYIYDSVAHRFPRSKFKTLDVTGLCLMDVQSVKNKIPTGLKRRSEPMESLIDGVDTPPTFFEVIDNSIADHTLAQRFIDSLRTLKLESPIKYDLLILTCYLYSCRIPTSLDVAIAYTREHGLVYQDIYNILESMSSFLSKYEGALSNSEQAYYVPRSRSIAESVINKVPSFDLRRLLLTFHNEVSPTKINRYDIFRRGGYDSGLVSRAFPNWEEGLDFYEMAKLRDDTPALRQQGAIYLSHKKQYNLAFSWIDEALAKVGRRNASVKNTYAVILFKANKDKELDSEVVHTLNESMRILASCYTSDIRKAYHAKVFANHAINFAERLSKEPESYTYLDQASTWLDKELMSRPGDRAMNRLLREIRQMKRTLDRTV